jgi:threonine synthase
MVTDDEILAAYRMMSTKDGVFCEPASAAGVAGVLKLKQQGYFDGKGGTMVCTVTGHGLKDPDNAVKNADHPISVSNNLDAVLDVMDL